MTPYLWAWLVMAVCLLLLLLALQRVFRGWGPTFLKTLFAWWLPALLLVPAPIPREAGEYAPAFVVFLFEGLFQRDGVPEAAGRILLVAALFATVLALIWYLAARALRRRGAPAG